MKKMVFDFRSIVTLADFYDSFIQQCHIETYFGRNLDALWDALTGVIALPVAIIFINLTPHQQKEFAELIALLKAAENEMQGDLHFYLSG